MWYYISFLYKTEQNYVFGLAEVFAENLGRAILVIKEELEPKAIDGVVNIGFTNMFQSPIKLERAK